MTFDIGGADYSVVRRHVLCRDGSLRRGSFDSSGRLLLVDGGISKQADVLNVLRHEHRHAWEFETGLCQNCSESRAQLGVVAARTFDRDWTRCGGLPAFLALPIGGTLPLVRRSPLKTLCGCCQHCGYTLADGRCISCE